jgi:hypothetical protein
MKDPVVEEIHNARATIAARFNHDLKAYAEYIRDRERRSDHKVVDLSKKKPTG